MSDAASPILVVIAGAFGLAAFWCAGHALRAAGLRSRLAWSGRAFALAGAAFAVWFPAELYGELVVVARVGGDDTAWLPRAIVDSFALMPLAVLPALVSLRSVRAGAVLFAAALAYGLFDEVVRPFGVIFPDMRHDLSAYVFSFGPEVLTILLLAVGRDGPALGPGLSGRYLTLGPAI